MALSSETLDRVLSRWLRSPVPKTPLVGFESREASLVTKSDAAATRTIRKESSADGATCN